MAKPMMIGHIPTDEEIKEYEVLKKEEREQPAYSDQLEHSLGS